jgi:molecular chaperone DnaK
MKAVGIDLGTTNSVAAINEGGRPRALTNRENEVLTPSVVSYNKRRGADVGEVIVGRPAAANASRDPANTIFSIKRLMGRQYGEPQVEEVQKRHGFQLAPAPKPDADDQRVKVLLNGKPHSPEEISATILKKIKADAELALGEPVTHAVITVPAYFEERQRHATAEAGKLAGLNVLTIIDEPTAAALAFGLGKEKEQHTVLVYDLGGGTFDISLIQMHNNSYNVLEMQGDNWLGGDDFDRMILTRIIEQIKSIHSVDPSSSPGFMMLMKDPAERAKKALSSQQEVEILESKNLPGVGMIDVDMQLTREEFERDIRAKLETTIDLVHKALDNQSLTPDDITSVLLVGGSTAIPLVHSLLTEVFGEGKVRRDINPMECVALGAAIYADRFDLQTDEVAANAAGNVSHITAMSLGIAAVDGSDKDHFEAIIPKGTPYPLDAPKKKTFRPTEANQRMLRLPVYEGDNERASLNSPQGEIEIPLREGLDLSQDIEISFDYDKHRIVTLRVSIGGAEVGVRQIKHGGARPKPQQPQAAAANGGKAATIAGDWREAAGATVAMGKHFMNGYRTYMADDDRKELEAAIVRADEAVKAGNEAECQKALSIIENKTYMGSGLASLMFIAETVINQATPRQAQVLSRAIAALRKEHAKGGNAQLENLMEGLSMAVADILNEKVGTPETTVLREAYQGMVRKK